MLKLIRNERESDTPKAGGVLREDTTQVERAMCLYTVTEQRKQQWVSSER